jgi:isocitrate dehydrogenase (NAD+)
VKTRHEDIDIVLMRQNTEGEYAMMEHESVPGVVESLKIMTDEHAERLCRYSFEWARANGRKKVTLIHKANIMKVTDGLLLEVSYRVAKDFPDIKHEQMIIDNCCMQLVSNPWQFDVMILTNLYGTIVANLVCGLTGGAGLTAGANIGPRYAIFEPATRNTGTSLAGTNRANPAAMLNASADMLAHLGLEYHSGLVSDAVDQTINVDQVHTEDLGGRATSMDFVQNVIDHIKRAAQ